MKRLFIWAGVLLFVIGMGVATFWNVPTWRLYTADWQPLAMTNAENYCTAVVGLNARFAPDNPDVQRCKDTTVRDNIVPDLNMSVTWACEGVKAAGWQGTMTKCHDIFLQAQLWMLVDGGLADASSWSDSHPRPVTIEEVLSDPRSNRAGDDESTSPQPLEEGE